MSDTLLWTLLRKNNNKVSKRTHPVMSTTIEKGSLRNTRTRKDSGYANRRAVDVSTNEDGLPVLSIRNDDDAVSRQPDKMWKSTTLSGGVRRAISKADTALKGYPADQRHAALAKISAIYLAQMRKNRGIGHATLLSAK